MTNSPDKFCLWLQGFAELSPEPPTPEQWKSIKEHLGLVFNKVTPPAPGNMVADQIGHATPAIKPSIFDSIKPQPQIDKWPTPPFDAKPLITC